MTLTTSGGWKKNRRVLSAVGADMELFRSRRMKELRVAVNPMVEERLKQMAGAGLGSAGTPSLSGKVRSDVGWRDGLLGPNVVRHDPWILHPCRSTHTRFPCQKIPPLRKFEAVPNAGLF